MALWQGRSAVRDAAAVQWCAQTLAPDGLISTRAQLLRKAADKYSLIVTMEENVHSGGFGEHVSAWYAEAGINVHLLQIAVQDTFVTHGSPKELARLTGIDAESIVQKILGKLEKTKA